MLSFLNSRDANILLVGSAGASLLVWQKRRLNLLARFDSSDDGYAGFDAALSSVINAPFTIVMDVIEEDFRTETVAHVTGSDRRALLTRKLNHLFRTTPYKMAAVRGREKTGRKDDKVFLTALTKPEILDPWLSRVLAKRIPVRAISSSAFVMERFARYLNINTNAYVLIVNEEEVIGVRQTYLQNGRVIFSRLTPASIQRTGTFEEFVEEQSTQTRRYLERIKQLPYDAALDVYVFSPLPRVENNEVRRDLLTFYYFSISELGRDFAISQDDAPAGALAYSLAKSFKKGALPNVYGPFVALRYFLIGKLRRNLYLSGALALIGTLGYLYPDIVEVRDKISDEQNIRLATAPLRQQYDTMRARFPETPIASGKMEVVVETYDRIASQVMDLSHILDAIGSTELVSPELQITEIAWTLEELPDESAEVIYTGLDPDEPQVVFQKSVAAGRTMSVVTVEGLVTSSGSRRESRERVLSFVDALAERSGLTVTPLTMPLDLNTASSLTTTLDNKPLAEDFVLEIRSEVMP